MVTDPATDAMPRPKPPASGEPVSVRHVSRSFGEVQALADVSLDVAAGEFVALLGPSGGGKTTLMRIIAGLVTADSGQVIIGGTDVTTLPARRRNVNTVFQDYALFPHLTVRDNIGYGPRVKGMKRGERAALTDRLLALVRLGDVGGRRPAELSGGQRQRVALARALANRPSVLLLDEPLAALDRQLRSEVQGELRRIHEEVGITFVFVTHDQEEAFGLADRVVVLRDGSVEQDGTPEQLYDEPATEWVAGFVGQQNVVAGRVVASQADLLGIAVEGFPSGTTLWGRPTVEGLGPGSSVHAMIRPERLSWQPADAQGQRSAARRNAIGASVVQSTSLGADTVLTVRDEADARWTARRTRTPHEIPPMADSPVVLSWNADDFHLYAA